MMMINKLPKIYKLPIYKYIGNDIRETITVYVYIYILHNILFILFYIISYSYYCFVILFT